MSQEVLVPAQSFKAISENLVVWSVYDPTIRTDLTSCALRTAAGWWLIDPAPIEHSVLRKLPLPQKILGVLLTNENHERASYDIARDFDCSIFIHQSAVGLLEKNVHIFLQDHQILEGEIEVLFLGGTSYAETCFYSSSQRLMIVGDALLNLAKHGFQLLPEKYCKDPIQAKKTLIRLLDKDFDQMSFAHGEILNEAHEKLKNILIQEKLL
jgi:glyoxylase-like metal-dependent hydrolase (beta-lactamase superfamily II)